MKCYLHPHPCPAWKGGAKKPAGIGGICRTLGAVGRGAERPQERDDPITQTSRMRWSVVEAERAKSSSKQVYMLEVERRPVNKVGT